MNDTFADRLNYLFAAVRPVGGQSYTLSEVAAALQVSGVAMSAPYLSQLRRGRRTNPSTATVAGLAAFFGVRPAYFTHEGYYRRIRLEMAAHAALEDKEVRDLTIQIAELPSPARQLIADHIYQLRRSHQLVPHPATS